MLLPSSGSLHILFPLPGCPFPHLTIFFFFSIWMTPSSDLSLNFTPSCCHCTLHLFINTAVCKFTFIWMDGWIVNVHFFHWTIHRLHEGRVLILQFIILSHCPAVVLAHGRCSSNVCGMTVDWITVESSHLFNCCVSHSVLGILRVYPHEPSRQCCFYFKKTEAQRLSEATCPKSLSQVGFFRSRLWNGVGGGVMSRIVSFPPPKRYVEVLAPRTSEYDFIWK